MPSKDAVRITRTPARHGCRAMENVYHWSKHKRSFFLPEEAGRAEEYAKALRAKLERERWERESKREERRRLNDYYEAMRNAPPKPQPEPEPEHTGGLVCSELYLASMQSDEHRRDAIERCERANQMALTKGK